MPKILRLLILLVVIGVLLGAADQPSPRPATWAQPRTLAGAPNLYKVTESLYRSAQPTAEGMRSLKGLGIRTVINLREFHSDSSKLKDTGLNGEHIPMGAWHPEVEHAVRFLRLATDPTKTPVLVHCQHGADRTGAMVAIYRVIVQGWTKDEALKEMVDGGFGFHGMWVNLKPWLEGLDMERIRREAGLTAQPSAGT